MSRLEDSSGITFAIINQDNKIILGDDNDPLLTELINQNELNYSLEKQQIVTNHMGQLYQLATLPSSLFTWNFIWINSKTHIDSAFSSLRNLLVLGSFAILILSILSAIYVSKKATKPMDELLSKINPHNNGVNFITDFRDSIQNTLNDNITMNEQLAKTSPIYKERILYSLLTNTKLDSDDTLNRLEVFKAQFSHSYYYVISVEIVNNYWDQFIEEESLINTIARDIMAISESKPYINIAFGISQKSNNTNHLHTLYLQSTKALHHRNLNTKSSLVFIDRINKDDHDICLYDLNEIFENNLLNGNKEACLNQINEVLNRISTSQQVSKTEFEQFILNILSIALRVSLKTRIDISNNPYLNGDIWHLTLSIKTIYAAENVLTDIITYVCDEISKLHTNNEHIHLNAILDYINQHYTENLSMDMVSEAINISSSYIYKILKDNNKTFTEYVTEKRLTAACELLKTDSKVKDIAEEIGFSNSKYFIHVFKKYKGMTPAQYRKFIEQ